MLEPEIISLARDVWLTMFGLDVDEGESTGEAGPYVTGVVHISGAWDGAVSLQCSAALAELLTRRLFGESTEAEVRDLIGELTNQLGGNIKALLPAPSALSLPAVAMGGDYDLRVLNADIASQVHLTCEGLSLALTLMEAKK